MQALVYFKATLIISVLITNHCAPPLSTLHCTGRVRPRLVEPKCVIRAAASVLVLVLERQSRRDRRSCSSEGSQCPSKEPIKGTHQRNPPLLALLSLCAVRRHQPDWSWCRPLACSSTALPLAPPPPPAYASALSVCSVHVHFHFPLAQRPLLALLALLTAAILLLSSFLSPAPRLRLRPRRPRSFDFALLAIVAD